MKFSFSSYCKTTFDLDFAAASQALFKSLFLPNSLNFCFDSSVWICFPFLASLKFFLCSSDLVLFFKESDIFFLVSSLTILPF